VRALCALRAEVNRRTLRAMHEMVHVATVRRQPRLQAPARQIRDPVLRSWTADRRGRGKTTLFTLCGAMDRAVDSLVSASEGQLNALARPAT